ncbi:MAG: PHP domain-containing protein [Oscillospiraceae bacterium]|nr:PHP domain-containing protein [Oscillospiraceae bacterium]
MYQDIFLLEKQLNNPAAAERLAALEALIGLERRGLMEMPAAGRYVNNHIHTIYSFSPYSPSAAVYFARKAGLVTAGIMDHDAVGGCGEFIKAGGIAGLPVTMGFALRVKMRGTPLYGRTLNNPDQPSVAYVAAHGIPHQKLADCDSFLAPFRAHRNIRNRRMTEKINTIISAWDLCLDFDRDILPLSRYGDGGSVTERHILCGLASTIIAAYGRGTKTLGFIKNELGIAVPEKVAGFLADPDNPHYVYDLLGALKSGFVRRFYIDADAECPDVDEFVGFAKDIGAISAYAYLGDITDSVTGDKKAQKFEDDFLDELFAVIRQRGFQAVTYMPSRNTPAQLRRVMALCEQYELFQISGEDINTSRQSFICPALDNPEFRHLNTATWVLIGHETAASKNIDDGMFSDKTVKKYPSVADRIPAYEAIGRSAGRE